MKDIQQIIVFVYGTLRKGELYSPLLYNACYKGTDIIPGFIMRDLGEYPMIFERNDSGMQIIIEVYKIDPATLQQLDNLEDYNENDDNSLYLRKKVTALSGIEGFIYYGIDEYKYKSCNIIPDGDWVKRRLKIEE
jgi:gamma-glutamylcyclotransferase (GGCT)/AIG2-like uncharacterized protein YtfP